MLTHPQYHMERRFARDDALHDSSDCEPRREQRHGGFRMPLERAGEAWIYGTKALIRSNTVFRNVARDC